MKFTLKLIIFFLIVFGVYKCIQIERMEPMPEKSMLDSLKTLGDSTEKYNKIKQEKKEEFIIADTAAKYYQQRYDTVSKNIVDASFITRVKRDVESSRKKLRDSIQGIQADQRSGRLHGSAGRFPD